jgi:hypothetical protein
MRSWLEVQRAKPDTAVLGYETFSQNGKMFPSDPPDAVPLAVVLNLGHT